MDPREFQNARKRVCLVSAGGEVLRGGIKPLKADFVFKKRKFSSQGNYRDFSIGGVVYSAEWNADASYDVILGYPWLRQHKIGVFPHMNALAQVTPDERVEWLWGWIR